MLLINTSVRENNNTSRVISCVSQYLETQNKAHDIAQMTIFDSFTEEYIVDMNSVPDKSINLIEKLITHSDHLYFVPTYYKSMPGVFKNYLDIVRLRDLYHHKRIGIVSTNAKNQDYGARQFLQSLLGLLEFHEAVSVVVPQILILNPDNTERQSVYDYLIYFYLFPSP